MSVLKWQNGNILHPAKQWVHPTMRRLPLLFVVPRAKEVVIKVSISGEYFVFEETDKLVASVSSKSVELVKYRKTWLLPAIVDGVDLVDYLRHQVIYIYADTIGRHMFYYS